MKPNQFAGRAFSRGVQRPRRPRVLRLQFRRAHVLWLLAFAAVIFLKVWQKTFIDHMNRRKDGKRGASAPFFMNLYE